jgi:AcrR family transcriptional regulator
LTTLDPPITHASPGRPRNVATDQAILENALKLLIEQGYNTMSIEAVANGAGVTKPTIYRRYPSKRELVAAAISSLVETFKLPPDSGSVRSDLLNYFRQVFTTSKINIASIFGAMIVSERDEPALMELLRRQIMAPRLVIANQLFQRGIKRGELRADISIPIVTQMLLGSLIARHVSGDPEDDVWLEDLVDTLLRGLAARSE